MIPLRVRNPTGVHANGYQTVPILCYHRFGNRWGKLAVTPAAFEAQMEYLARNGYSVISLKQLARFLDGKEALPPKSVVITIDDGYRSTYDIAFPDPAQARLSRHRVPVQRLRRRLGCADVAADEGDDRVRPRRHRAAFEDALQPDAARCPAKAKRATASA